MSSMKDRSKINRDGFGEFQDNQTFSTSGWRPFSEILQEIVTHISEIIRSEIRLAQAEVREDVTRVVKASLFFLGGAVFGLYAFGLVLLAVVYGLAMAIPAWTSALIVGVAVGIISAILLLIGREKMKLASLKPDKTIQSLQENVTWLKKQTK